MSGMGYCQGPSALFLLPTSYPHFLLPTMLRIVSYNIRYNNPADGINAWPHRQAGVVALLQRHRPDLIGLQEVRHEQLTALAAALPDYGWLGVGRDDGATAGEYAPIFYRRRRLTIKESGHFWLSETPDVAGSFGWDAACTRIATWAIFTDQATEQSLLHLNTHLDHRGMAAQLGSVDLIYHFLARQALSFPAIVTGDFNCVPNSTTYHALTKQGEDGNGALQDTMYLSRTAHEGPLATFTTDFTNPLQEKIDYIFLSRGSSRTEQMSVARHAILDDRENGRYPSDHLPVLVELTS